jgi:Rrf2 family protein
MKLNTRARYSVRLMRDIEAQGQGATVALKDVAKRQKITKRYLEQIVIPLKKASLVKGVPGKNGGYKLMKSASDITLLEIIEAAGGPIRIFDCISENFNCPQRPKCLTRGVWFEINSGIINVLSTYKLSDLREKHSKIIAAETVKGK